MGVSQFQKEQACFARLFGSVRWRFAASRALASSTSYNEVKLLRYSLIDPLLRELGRDTGDPDQVQPEYRVGTGRAEYALLRDGSPVAMVEAKSLGTSLTDSALALWRRNVVSDSIASAHVPSPSKPNGREFLKAHNAWGFPRIAQSPKYLALYISKPAYEIQYFGEIDRVIDPANEDSPVGPNHPGPVVIADERHHLVLKVIY